MPQPSPRSLRRIAAVLLVSGISLTLSLVVAEAAVRIADPFYGSPGGAMYHPTRGEQLVAGFRGRYRRAPVYVDDLGFRDYDRQPPLSRAKRPGVTRVMVFGDSFAFGDEFPIEDSFPYQMEQLLRKMDPARHWEVVNAGVPGYDSIQEDTYVRETALALSADIVVLEYTMNDADDYRPPRFVGVRASVQPLVDWMRANSYLYNLLYVDVLRIRELLSGQGDGLGDVDWFEHYSDASPHYQAMRGALIDIDSYLGANGVPLIVLIYGLGPTSISLRAPPPRNELFRDYPLAPLHENVKALIKSDLRARYIDALDVIGSMTLQEVYDGKGHPGATANAPIAQALAICALEVAQAQLRPSATSSPCVPSQ
jgi:hypothetical protein